MYLILKKYKMELTQISFNLTSKCNLSCEYCAIEEGKSKTFDLTPEIAIEGYKRIRDKYPNRNLDLNCIGNGEPLLNWKTIEAIDNIKNLDEKVRCFVTTNGTLQDKCLELAKRSWIITVSYDGINNQKRRGRTNEVESTIKKLAENEDYKFLVRMTTCPEDLDYLDKSLDKIQKFGAKYVVLGPIFPLGKSSLQKLDKSFDLDKLYNSLNYAEKIGLKPILTLQQPCTLATKGYYIMPNGEVSICYAKSIKPNKKDRQKAENQGCILYNYNEIIKI
jgi:MoaA/NifB/PqqE/SkfB family radical SAM enzyme